MPTNRKRKQGRITQQHAPQEPPAKKRKLPLGKGSDETAPLTPVQHAVLDQYYPQLLTLRDYVLLKLPATSRIRRRKIASTGGSSVVSNGETTDIERAVGQVLDTTLVGVVQHTKCIPDKRWEHWETYASQKGDESHVTLSDGLTGARFSQSEVRPSHWTPLHPYFGGDELIKTTDCGVRHMDDVFQIQENGHLAKTPAL